jgi:hypothetical protein
MPKTILLIILLLCNIFAYSQQQYLVLRKKNKSLQFYWKDSHFTFQQKDGQWITGILTKITTDSFYLTKEIIRYNSMGTDTLRYGGFSFEIKDVYALPTKKELIVFGNDEVHIILGHEKFAWVRNGFIFMVAGAGYAGISVVNDLATNTPPFAKENLAGLGIAAGVFLAGLFLHHNFDPYIHLGKKYQLISG